MSHRRTDDVGLQIKAIARNLEISSRYFSLESTYTILAEYPHFEATEAAGCEGSVTEDENQQTPKED